MPVRFDRGEFRSSYINHDGTLIADATFARDGILEYQMPDGSIRRELRLPEENKKALTGFGLAPITLEHPPVLVTADNAENHRKGISLADVTYGKGGFVRGVVAVMDSAAIDYIKDGAAELSPGYTCNLEEKPGVWNGQRYDAIQRDLQINHIAITRKGRSGPLVRVHMDSAESNVGVQVVKSEGRRMASIRIDSVDYDVPAEIAPVLGSKLSRLDALEEKTSSLEAENDRLQESIDELTDERDRERGRADAQDICLTNAEAILADLGYRRDATGDYIRVDKCDGEGCGSGKKKMDMSKKYKDMDDEDMDDMSGDEDMSEEEEMPPKGKKKGKKKMDSADIRTDAKALMLAWKEADQLAPGLSDEHFDSADTPIAVQRLVLAKVRPSLAEKLDSMSDEAVTSVYDLIKEDSSASVRGDAKSTPSAYSLELNTAISASRSMGNPGATLGAVTSKRSEELSQAYLQPLSLSR